MLTAINQKILKDIIWFLEPFRRVIADLQAKDRPTLPLIVPCVWYLKNELKTSAIDSSILCFLKDKCLTILERKIELQDIYFAVAMLNPNYRTLRGATKSEQTQAQRYLKKRLQAASQSVASSAQATSSSSDDDDNCHYLRKYVNNPRVSKQQDELSQYLKMDHRETNTNDILGFLENNV